MAPRAHSEKEELLLHTSLFIFESSLVVMAMAMYIKGERPFSVFLSSGTGTAFLCAIATFFIAGWVIVHRYLVSKRLPSRYFRLVVMTNLVSVLLILITGEIIVRAGSQSQVFGEAFMNVVLTPKNWEQAKLHYSQILEKSRADLPLKIYDNQLGWTVGRNRFSFPNGEAPYWSSAEGIRASRKGVTYSKVDGKTDIAIVGDSFTFGDEVRFENTWGYALERLLGEEFRVLNFGVPGYGLGQAYLRYEDEVRQWNPKIAIIGFIENDLLRTMRVYPFLRGSGLPFSKPRFVLQDGELRTVNLPSLPPEEIFSRRSVLELPFLEYDSGYSPSDWQKRWYHVSYLVRLFTSLYAPWSDKYSEEELVPLNAAILKAFARSVEQAGSIPLIVYFPRQSELSQPGSYLSLGKRVLQTAGLPYLDPTPCLLEVPLSEQFEPGGHYTPQGNIAVAKCLVDAIREALGQPSSRRLSARG